MARLRAAATVSMEVATASRGPGGEPTGVVLVASVAAMGIAQGRDRVSDSGGVLSASTHLRFHMVSSASSDEKTPGVFVLLRALVRAK